jgi:hypothetical protein
MDRFVIVEETLLSSDLFAVNLLIRFMWLRSGLFSADFQEFEYWKGCCV